VKQQAGSRRVNSAGGSALHFSTGVHTWAQGDRHGPQLHRSQRQEMLQHQLLPSGRNNVQVKRFHAIVTGQWAIEYELHWQLVVTFRQDHWRTRGGNAVARFSILRRTALTLVKNKTIATLGVSNKRFLVDSDENYTP